ncbi:MAG: hypothetical protein M1825_005076 [Sarcosagium campestre]|nr:MAG: hypothetical protein M1825_005076 [Sarcosagium campestre]
MAPHAVKRRRLGDQGMVQFSDDDWDDEATGYGEHEHGRSSSGPSTTGVSTNSERRPTQGVTSNGTSGIEAFTTGSYKSSMFKLQVDEMLDDLKPDYTVRMKEVEDALRKLKRIIEDLPAIEERKVDNAKHHLSNSHNIIIPFPTPGPSKDVNYKLAYGKPAHINVIGGYVFGTAIASAHPITIDLAVTMPVHLFQEKDYLNYRYFHKRAYYLAVLAAGIRNAEGSAFNVNFSSLNGSDLQPTLILTPSKESGKYSYSNAIIQVLPIAPENLFPVSKTSPDKNCIRPAAANKSMSGEKLAATPLYNAALCTDMLVTSYLRFLHASSTSAVGYKDACMLGRIWLGQRGFSANIHGGGFGHFEWAALMAVLLQGGGPKGQSVFSSGYSSYQLFKAMLQFLSTRDLITKPFVDSTEGLELPTHETAFFFDGERGINILYKMTPWSYKLLRHEAANSLKMLNDSAFDPFESAFVLNENEALQKFDQIVRLRLRDSAFTSRTSLDHVSGTLDRCQKLYRVLSRGLADRVQLIDISWDDVKSHHASGEIDSPLRNGLEILVKLIVNPSTVNRTVDHGPSAESKKEAAEFRKFWGEKSELRRFKDGSILESLVWTERDDGSQVLHQVIQYLIRRYLTAEMEGEVEFVSAGFQKVLPKVNTDASSSMDDFQPWNLAFDDLEKKLRAMEGLPLQIRQLSASSPLLRYSAIDLPSRTDVGTVTSPADIVLQFEGSGRWPDDLVAIQRTKIALLLKVSELLAESDPDLTMRVGLENETKPMTNASFLDITNVKTATSFRLRVHSDREQTLLDRRQADKSLTHTAHTETTLALSAYKRTFIHGPAHTRALRTLSTRFPLLSSTLRLVQAWFASHLLTPHIPIELVDLITIHTFTTPYPWSAPSSSHVALLRTLLFLSRWDWRTDPLLVSFTAGDLNRSTLDTIRATFAAVRKADAAMQRAVLFVASPIDPSGIAWTQHARPPKVLAARMTSLARAACKVVKESGLNLRGETIFISSTNDYSFLLHLAPSFAHNRRGITGPRASPFKNLAISPTVDTSLVGYDPVRLFIDELEKLFSPHILFLYNSRGGSFIAGLWSPQPETPRAWKVGLGYSSMPVGKGDQMDDSTDELKVVINKTAILNEIARLGGDLISKVEVIHQ